MKQKDNQTRYTCEDFRQEMILNGLRKRYYSKELSAEERRQLAAEIEKLEAMVGMR
jgi:hypothetical protein